MKAAEKRLRVEENRARQAQLRVGQIVTWSYSLPSLPKEGTGTKEIQRHGQIQTLYGQEYVIIRDLPLYPSMKRGHLQQIECAEVHIVGE